MPSRDELIAEFDREMITTRRLLERVPAEHGEWKPHPKSFPLGHLAQLVAWMPGWITNAVTQSELQLGGFAGYTVETTEWLLATFDQNVREAKAALAAAQESDWAAPWALKRGSMTLWSATRGEVVRTNLNHLVHHRGQLTVYLRLKDVPIPSIYGPTADERM